MNDEQFENEMWNYVRQVANKQSQIQRCDACKVETNELFIFDNDWLCNDCFEYSLAEHQHNHDTE